MLNFRRAKKRRSETKPCRSAWPTILIIATMACRILIIATMACRLDSRSAEAQNAQPPAAIANAPAGRASTAPEIAPKLPDGVQIVKFRVPRGVKVEVLAPPPEVLPDPERAQGAIGLKIGVAYRLKLSDLPDRPGAALFPVIQIVGHLHRPPEIDPYRFPLRIPFNEGDFDDVLDHERLVTEVVYLEDPESAAPIALPKEDIPLVNLSAVEDPLKVSAALGRLMAIVRLGGRAPTMDELKQATTMEVEPHPCPYSTSSGLPCGLPCGPGRAVSSRRFRSARPGDEYLCDGGDRGEPMHFELGGALFGIDPRDSAARFNDGRRDRVLPTNAVCVYAPRFAATRASFGVNRHSVVQPLRETDQISSSSTAALRQEPRRFVKNEPAVIARHRSRPSNMKGRVYAGINLEMRVLSGFGGAVAPKGNAEATRSDSFKRRQRVSGLKTRVKAFGIKTAESAVATGIVEGAGEKVSTWPVQDVNGVELPPKRPGLAIVKRVSANVAEPGDSIAYQIRYRNMGNTPIRDVSIIDSLTARLAYERGSALGPPGTVFTAGENREGATELRWDLPRPLAPGEEGSVSFKATVR